MEPEVTTVAVTTLPPARAAAATLSRTPVIVKVRAAPAVVGVKLKIAEVEDVCTVTDPATMGGPAAYGVTVPAVNVKAGQGK